MHFTAYALPAIFALLAKACMFFYARFSKVHNLQTRLFLLFLFGMAIQDLAEIYFFLARESEAVHTDYAGRLWYGAAIFALPFLLHLALLSGTEWRGKKDNIPGTGITIIYAPIVILEVLLWRTHLLIAGFEPMSYTITQVRGPLYFLFQIFVVANLCTTTGLLIRGARIGANVFRRRQSKFLLIGLLPFVLLAIVILALRQFGFRTFNATATLPIMITFLLVVTAYATHQYRLFDMEFFIPWSSVRKRKTAFYTRIQALIAEVSRMDSVNKVIESISDVLHCPVALIAGRKHVLSLAGEAFGIARFPLDELRKLDHIVIANEITAALPATHALMKRHKVAAIVPFYPHSRAAASWMLLGDTFSDHVYSPLDFQTVGTLFARLADHFLDNQLLLRSQLADAQREMDTLHARLALAWEHIEELRTKLATTERENQWLWARNAETLHEDLTRTQGEMLEDAAWLRRSLDDRVEEFEARLIAKTLEHCDDDVSRAAELLNVPLATLYYKLRQYHLSKLKARN